MTTLNQAICGKLPGGAFPVNGKEDAIETIRREDLAWLAGIIDGEGNINVGFYGNGQGDWKVFRISVAIVNTHADMIQRATEILHGLGLFFKVHLRNRNPNERPCFSLVVNGQHNACKLLLATLPWLTCKRELAEQAIAAYSWRKELARGGNNQYESTKPRVQDNEILHTMIGRAKELVAWRPDTTGYSMIASEPIKVKKPSETTRLTAIKADDIVRPV